MNTYSVALRILCIGLLASTGHAGEFTVSTFSYLGGSGDSDEVRGVRVMSDGTIVLGATLGDARPAGLIPRLINGVGESAEAGLVHLSQDGKTVLSVTLLADRIWDISVSDDDAVYVAAGSAGLLKVAIGEVSSQLLWKRAEGNHIYRVDAAHNGDVACLQPQYTGEEATGLRTEDISAGAGTIRAYHANGDLITEFPTYGGRHANDVAIFDGAGNPDDGRIMWVGWRNGWAYTGPSDACADSLVNGISTTVHIGSVFGVTYQYDGTNPETELVYRAYDRGERLMHIWLEGTPEDPKLRRQEHANPEFFNGPINISELYTTVDVDAARTDGLLHNDWLWIEEDNGNSFVGAPKNIIYQEAFDWYQQGFPDSPEYISDDFRYPGWCSGRNYPDFVGNPYHPGGNNMADTRGLRIAMGRDNMLYATFESAGGNSELRWDPYNLSVGALKAAGDSYHTFYNIGSAHAMTIARYFPVTGEIERYQQFAANYRTSVGQIISNSTLATAGDITADERGRVYIVGKAAGELPIPGAANYGNTPAFNPYPHVEYYGGAYLVVLNPQMTAREYATRLTFAHKHSVDARILGDPLTDEAIIAFGGRDEMEGSIWLRDAIQTSPGYGQRDGVFGVLGGDETVTDDVMTLIVGGEDWPETSYNLNFRGVGPAASNLDWDGDGLENDRRHAWDFSSTVPLSAGNPLYTGLPFYGGFELIKKDDTGGGYQASRTGIKDSGLGIGSIGSHVAANLFIYFDKQDLPGVTEQDRLSFNRFTRPGIRYITDRQWSQVRFVVRDGNTFYVAEETGSGPRHDLKIAADTDHGRWAVWDPASGLAFDASQAVFAHRVFQNITAMGALSSVKSTSNTIGLYTRLTAFVMEFAKNDGSRSAPVAQMTVSPKSVASGETVQFNGAASFDPDGLVTFYAWSFNDDDKTTNSGPAVSHSFITPGNYRPTLSVYDADLNMHAIEGRVWVGPPAVRNATAGRVFASYDIGKSQKDWRKTSQGSLDLDGDGNAWDGWVGAPFSETVKLESRNSTSLYGGFIAEFLNSTRFLFQRFRCHGDSFEIRPLPGAEVNETAPDPTHRVHGVIYIDQADFLNGAEFGTVGLDTASFLETKITELHSNWDVRWVVRDPDGFYVSQTKIPSTGIHRLTNPGSIAWALYEPAQDLDFDQDNAVFSQRTFSDIRAIGLYVEQDSYKPQDGQLRVEYLLGEGWINGHPMPAPPVPVMAMSPQNPAKGETVTFDASASTNLGFVNKVRWDFGDGAFAISETADGTVPSLTAQHQYGSGGAYVVELTLSDTAGQEVSASGTIAVSGLTSIFANFSLSAESGMVPLEILFDGSGSWPDAGEAIVNYAWDFGDGTTLSGPASSVSHTFLEPGSYYVFLEVTDSGGNRHSSHRTVSVSPVVAAPSIDQQPQGASLVVGESHTFEVVASGVGYLSHQWFRNGVPIDGAVNPVLAIPSVVVADSGSYAVAVSNHGGVTTSDEVLLAVAKAEATVILSELAHAFDGMPKSPVVVTDPAGLTVDLSYDGSPQAPSAIGNYLVVATVVDADYQGSATAELLILESLPPPPVILQEPESALIGIGGSHLFAVAASSDDPISYQWYKDDLAIDGAVSSSLPVTSAAEADSGIYQVAVSNLWGTSWSAEATLTVSDEILTAIYHYDFDANGGSGVTVADVSGIGTPADATLMIDATPTDLFTPDAEGVGFRANFTTAKANMLFSAEKWNTRVAGNSNAFTFVWTLQLNGFGEGGDYKDRAFIEDTSNAAFRVGATAGDSGSNLRIRADIGSLNGSTAALNAAAGVVVAVSWSATDQTLRVYSGTGYGNLALHDSVVIAATSLPSLSGLRFGDSSSRSPRMLADDLQMFDAVLSLPELRSLSNSEPDAYEQWTIANSIAGGPDAQTGGIENLLRYALGGTAQTPLNQLLPQVQYSVEGANREVRITFNRIDDPLLLYAVWYSEDLQDWGIEPVWDANGAADGIPGPQEVSVATDSSRTFLRLEVIRE